MLLRNFYNWLASTVIFPASNSSVFGDGYLNLKQPGGYIYGFSSNYISAGSNNASLCMSGINSIATSTGAVGICFGSGTTAVTFDDYCLENLISTLSASNFSRINATYSSGTYTSTLSFVLTNTSSTSITINEIGITRSIPYASSYNAIALVYREVLSTPITLAANESVTYTHNFEFTMPTIS